LNASKPLIGMTTYRQEASTGVWSGDFALLPGEYLRGVEESGGTAVLIHPQKLDAQGAARIVSGIDGLLLPGGRDIEPARYGSEALDTTEEPDLLRDHTEHLLLEAAIKATVPILGICRGAQMLNVHRGGTLHQHLPDLIGHNRYQRGNAEFTMMPVIIHEGTLLAEIYGGALELEGAAMYHHQAINQPGAGLVVSALGPDGLIEAIELTNYPFGLAVQWHPERTLEDLRLFQALIHAAQASHERPS